MENADKPAYPVDSKTNEMINQGHWWEAGCGLTKRERFAMAAMQGICANPEFTGDTTTVIADLAIAQAEETLKLLEEANDAN